MSIFRHFLVVNVNHSFHKRNKDDYKSEESMSNHQNRRPRLWMKDFVTWVSWDIFLFWRVNHSVHKRKPMWTRYMDWWVSIPSTCHASELLKWGSCCVVFTTLFTRETTEHEQDRAPLLSPLEQGTVSPHIWLHAVIWRGLPVCRYTSRNSGMQQRFHFLPEKAFRARSW